MAKKYIILLKNNHLVFTSKQIKKQGNYTKEVRLFEMNSSVTGFDICDWSENEHEHKSIKEVNNWE